ncbi:hypothetical protein Cpir12675_006507 [Ceratocystis pirilliformis]|uniref:Uncharacterized protein n=1 Tax=Ceratocystis pirilliformis TaxID=259994 RepID=A0ABR3YGS8_9PEZI
MRVSSLSPEAGRLEKRWPQPEPARQTLTSFVTVTATVTGPTATFIPAVPATDDDDDELSDWDSEFDDDDQLDWDKILDTYSAEDLACESGDEGDDTSSALPSSSSGLGGYVPNVPGIGTGTSVGTGTAAPPAVVPSVSSVPPPAVPPPAAPPAVSSSTPAPAPPAVAPTYSAAPAPPAAAPPVSSSTAPTPPHAPPAPAPSTSSSVTPAPPPAPPAVLSSSTSTSTSTQTQTKTTTFSSTTFSTSIRKTKTKAKTTATTPSSTPLSDSIITYAATPAAVEGPAPVSSVTSILLGGLYGSDPLPTLATATQSAASTPTPELSTNSSRATAAGIAVGTTAGVVFAASAIFILARMHIRRKADAAGDRSEAGSSAGSRSPAPSISPVASSPNHHRAMTNSQLMEDVMAVAYGKELPKATPAPPTEPVQLPPGMVAHDGRASIFPYYDTGAIITPAPAGASYGYQDGQDYSPPPHMMANSHSPPRTLVEPYLPDLEDSEAGDRTTVMIWMGGVDGLPSPNLAPNGAPMTPLPLTPSAMAPFVPRIAEPQLHPGYPADTESSELDEAVRIPSIYASQLQTSGPAHRKSSFYPDDPMPEFMPMPEFSRPESPWEWNQHEAQARHEADARRRM